MHLCSNTDDFKVKLTKSTHEVLSVNTQNDVLNEPGFVLSLVLQHAEVVFGNGRRRRLLRCVRNVTVTNTEGFDSFYNARAEATALPFCDASRLFI